MGTRYEESRQSRIFGGTRAMAMSVKNFERTVLSEGGGSVWRMDCRWSVRKPDVQINKSQITNHLSRTTLAEGPAFSAKYSILLNKWRTRLSVAWHREVANAIIAGARNARGGERACPAEGSEGVIHLFEPVRSVVGF
jgi:hypothetical protein